MTLVRKFVKIVSTLGAGNCPACGGPLTEAGNCANLCGGV